MAKSSIIEIIGHKKGDHMTQSAILHVEIDACPAAHRMILECYRLLSVLDKRTSTQFRPFSPAELDRLARITALLDFRKPAHR